MARHREALGAIALVCAASVVPGAGAVEVSGYLASDLRLFAGAPADPRQRRNALSIVAQPELYTEWDGGNQSVLFVPFARVDSADPERTHADLREAFEVYGTVDSANVITDRDSGRSKGFGFVEMPDNSQADAAIKALNDSQLSGRTIKVNEARPRENRGGGGRRY